MLQNLLYPRQVVLVTASTSEKSNVTAVEWIMPVAEKPPLVALSLANNSLTLDLICTSMEFVVSIPSERLKEAAILCGSTSGKYIDKFEEARLTQVRAKKVSAPLVLEAIANLECKVLSYNTSGDHTVVVGEVVEVHLPKQNGEQEPLLFNHGGKRLFGFKKEG
ncbi:MAG: flavin reductase family protein [Candidatus Micrarchaeota archaeon]|nr:flavin reductase family protein [Candidatus Micrarchaeota archaeon]